MQLYVPLAGCFGYYRVALCENTDDKSWCCKSKGVCVQPLHSLGQLQGRLLALFLSFPFLYLLLCHFGTLFPTWPFSGNRSCGRKTRWGLIGLGRRLAGSSPQGPRGLCQPVRRSRVLPVLCWGPVLPRAGVRSVLNPLGRCDDWEGTLTPFFSPLSLSWGKSTSGNFANKRPTVSLMLKHL